MLARVAAVGTCIRKVQHASTRVCTYAIEVTQTGLVSRPTTRDSLLGRLVACKRRTFFTSFRACAAANYVHRTETPCPYLRASLFPRTIAKSRRYTFRVHWGCQLPKKHRKRACRRSVDFGFPNCPLCCEIGGAESVG